MTHKIRRVDVEKHAYYVNKLRQNVELEIWLWRQSVTSQTAHTKYKWPPYVTEWNPHHEIFCVRHCWQLLWFAHALQLINLIEVKSESLFYQGLRSQCDFISSCDLFWSHQTVELLTSVVWTSQSTPAQRMFAHFVRLSPGAKLQSVTLTDFLEAQTVTVGKQRISPNSDFFKIIFTHSDYSRPNSFRLCRPGSGSSV